MKTVCSRRSNEQGFALPLAVGLGLVMLLTGVTMLVRSQSDQTTAWAQKSTAQSLSITETGVTRVENLINNVRILSTKNLNQWRSAYNSTNIPSCASSNAALLSSIDITQYVDASGNGIDVSVPNSTSPVGTFRILSYNYDSSTNIGTLQIEGKPTNATAKSVLQVKIPVTSPAATPIPGLWVNNISTGIGNNQVSGNVLIRGCTTSTSGVYTNSDGTTTPSLTNNIQNGQIVANPLMRQPPVPDLPSGGVCPTIRTTANTTTVSAQLRYNTSCYYSISGAIAGSGTPVLPRPVSTNPVRAIDIPTSDGNYYYLIGKNASGNSIDDADMTVTTTSSSKVILYIEGNIEMSSNSTVALASGSVAPNFQVFGSDNTANHYCSSGCNTTSIHFNGNPVLKAFIYAPNATALFNGCGNSPSCVLGSLWVNNWGNGSNANNLVVTQTGNWSDLSNFITDFWQPINPVTSWQRQPAP